MNSPNVLFILADDLGWGDVGCHGSRNFTPNIDRLARVGVELDQHYVAPVCTPTRVALMTGRYPSRFGRHATWPTNDPVLPDGYRTLASMFRESGYATGLFGKWHLGSSPEFHPGHFGFDTSYGSLAGGVDPYNHLYKAGPFSRTWHRDGNFIEERGHATDLITAEASRWIGEQSRPWFCYVPFTAVHTPVTAPEPWVDRYENVYHDPLASRDRALKLYGAYTSHMDHCIGRLIETIKCLACLDNTIVVFASDNGAPIVDTARDVANYPGFHERPHSVGSNAPLRGGKAGLYEGGIRTPSMFYWQGRVAPRRLSAPMCISDWMPTFAEMLGAEPDPRWDGESVWAALNGAEPSRDRTIHWNVRHTQFAVRHGDWKLIHRLDGLPETELFNISNDPFEQQDIAAEHPALVTDLRRSIEENRRRDDSDVYVKSAEAPSQPADDDP